MKLIVKEIHTTEYFCFPIIEIELNNSKELPNIITLNNRELEKYFEESYPNLLNFSHGLFDSLSENTIEKLETIFAINNDYINYKLWTYFLAISELDLPPIKRKTKTFNTSMNSSTIIDYFNNKTNTDIKDMLMKEYNSITKIFPFLNRTTNKISSYILLPKDVDTYLIHDNYNYKSHFQISYEVSVNNEIDLLYAFLDIVFSSKFRYYIKKCEQCKKFFITTKSDTKYCSRVDLKYNKSCSQLATVTRLQYGNLNEFQKVDKRVRAFFSRQADVVGRENVNEDFKQAYKTFKLNNPNRTAEQTISFLENYRKDYTSSLTKL